jgi:hypothetical protein
MSYQRPRPIEEQQNHCRVLDGRDRALRSAQQITELVNSAGAITRLTLGICALSNVGGWKLCCFHKFCHPLTCRSGTRTTLAILQ